MTRANSLTKAIIQFLNFNGHVAMRNNTVGIWDARKKIYRKNQDRSAIGSGDILCCLKGGKWLEIEVKVGKDKQNPEQERREYKIFKTGGEYLIVRNWEEFDDRYKYLIQRRNK